MEDKGNNVKVDDNKNSDVESNKAQKKTKKFLNKKVLYGLLALLVLCLAVGGVYYWRDKVANDMKKQYDADISSRDKTIKGLREQITLLNGKDDDVSNSVNSQCSAITTTQADNIKASITSGNTQPLEGYMASTVNVIFAATEGVGPTTPTSAVSNITNFIADATSPWNFALPNATLTSYRQSQGYQSYFPANAIVGKSANEKVISFSFNCNAKINTVFMAISEDLLLQ